MRTLFTLALTTLAIGAAGASPAAAQTRYSITDLGLLSGSTGTTPRAVNDLGVVVGAASFPAVRKAPAYTKAFLWKPAVPNGVTGTLFSLGALPGGVSSQARDINSSGTVVGYSDVGTNASGTIVHAFRWKDANGNGISDVGEMQDLNTVPSADGATAASHGWELRYAYALNDLGQVVGMGGRYDSASGTWKHTTFLWQIDSAGVVKITEVGLGVVTASGNILDSDTRDINEYGQAAGSIPSGGTSFSPWRQAALWKQDELGNSVNTQLGFLYAGDDSQARSVNDLGQAVGFSETQFGDRAFLWLADPAYNLPQGIHDLGTLGGYTRAEKINNLGQAVGQSLNSAGYYRAFVWTGSTGIRDLNLLANVGTSWTLTSAASINNAPRPQIIGTGTLKGKSRAFLLSPQ